MSPSERAGERAEQAVRKITEGEGLRACTVCGEWFITLPIQTSCSVAHSPGSCCHYGEEAVDGRAIQLTPRPFGGGADD